MAGPEETLRDVIACWHPSDWGPSPSTVEATQALDFLAAELRAANDARDAVEHREGVMEVYDWQGNYRGCLGVETWAELVASAVSAA